MRQLERWKSVGGSRHDEAACIHFTDTGFLIYFLGTPRYNFLRALLGENQRALGFVEFQPVPGSVEQSQIRKGEVADARSKQAQGGVADGGGHAPNLAVFALVEGEGEPAVGNVFSEAYRRLSRRERGDLTGGHAPHPQRGAGVVGQPNAGGEAGERLGGRYPFNLHPIFAFVGVTRVEQPGVESRFVGKQQQALAVGVEPAKGINPGWQARAGGEGRGSEVGEGFPRGPGLGGELGQDAVGFVEREEQGYGVDLKVANGGLTRFVKI